jgi:hypothetical protein
MRSLEDAKERFRMGCQQTLETYKSSVSSSSSHQKLDDDSNSNNEGNGNERWRVWIPPLTKQKLKKCMHLFAPMGTTIPVFVELLLAIVGRRGGVNGGSVGNVKVGLGGKSRRNLLEVREWSCLEFREWKTSNDAEFELDELFLGGEGEGEDADWEVHHQEEDVEAGVQVKMEANDEEEEEETVEETVFEEVEAVQTGGSHEDIHALAAVAAAGVYPLGTIIHTSATPTIYNHNPYEHILHPTTHTAATNMASNFRALLHQNTAFTYPHDQPHPMQPLHPHHPHLISQHPHHQQPTFFFQQHLHPHQQHPHHNYHQHPATIIPTTDTSSLAPSSTTSSNNTTNEPILSAQAAAAAAAMNIQLLQTIAQQQQQQQQQQVPSSGSTSSASSSENANSYLTWM